MLGILCGLEAEAIIARQIKEALVVCSAARPPKARELVRQLIQKGVTRVISFGVAGGLEPGLPIGATVIASHIASPLGTWECDPILSTDLAHKIPEAHCGGVWGSETLIPSALEKHNLYQSSQCLIVDMESQCAAEIASTAGIPFGVIRTVCDGANMDVPPLVMDAINEDGRVNYGQALKSLVRHPLQVKRLLHVHKSMQVALKALEHSVEALR